MKISVNETDCKHRLQKDLTAYYRHSQLQKCSIAASQKAGITLFVLSLG